MATENQTLPKLLNEKPQFSEHARTEALVVKLARFYSLMGNHPDEPGALALMAEFLCQSASDEQIVHAMTRCARECRYPVRLSDFLHRIPGQEIAEPEAEARKAWDLVVSFATKWVQSDPEGNYVISRGVRSSEPPTLSNRILVTVRRTGSWAIYARMTAKDFPFVQKRFLEEYQAYTAVERVELPKLIREIPQLQLVAKSMDPPKVMRAAQGPAFHAKRMPTPLSDAQLRDRREQLKQQAELMKSKRP